MNAPRRLSDEADGMASLTLRCRKCKVRGCASLQEPREPSPHALKVLADCLRELDISSVVFEKNCYGTYFRSEYDVEARRRVWAAMRKRRDSRGPLSYPEIAAATGTTHSTVITALRRMESVR